MKRILGYIMSFILVFACVIPTAGATGLNTDVKGIGYSTRDIIMTDEFYEIIEKKTNIEFIYISEDNSHIEYIYSEDDKNYKVVEKTNPELTHIESEIYIQKDDGAYILDSSIITDIVNEDEMLIQTTKNGKVETEKIKSETIDYVNPDLIESTLVEDETVINKEGFQVLTPRGYVTTDWQYHSTTRGSKEVRTHTIAVVTSMVTAYCTSILCRLKHYITTG